jgi:VIT1/CCC1 family predicted Fe2+/Mn2+ transporter
MAEIAAESSRRVLDPGSRIAEVLFGLIMVLTFTGSLSVADAGRDDVRAMLIGALGCNLAWGIIDGLFYVMGSLAEKGRNLLTYQALRREADARKAQALIAGVLPPLVASILQPAELESIHKRLLQLPEPPRVARAGKEDWLGAFAVCLLVFLTTLPVAVPFMFLESVERAMRISNAIAVVLLFIAGFAYGRHIGRSSLGFGTGMVVVGVAIVSMTIALGG